MKIARPKITTLVENGPAPTQRMREQRRHPRRLTLRTGKIVTFASAIDCAVLDISAGGARILSPRGSEIPEAFELIIDPTEFRIECTLVWTDGPVQGVAFNQEALTASQVWFLESDLGGA